MMKRDLWPWLRRLNLAALATATMGIINVLSSVTPFLHDRIALLATFSPLEVRVGGHLSSIIAFGNLVTEYNRNEITIDLMRRRYKIENGTMEFLFVALFQWAKEQGFATFNLGLSALSGVGEEPDDPAVERALHYIYEHVNQFYNFKGLHEFKQKFHPSWSPRYLVFLGYATLPMVGFTLESISSGPDFLLDYATQLLRHLRGLWHTRASRVEGVATKI